MSTPFHDVSRARFTWVLVGGFWACFVATVQPVFAQRTEGCPIAKSDYGTVVQRTFTDSKGRKAQVFFSLPAKYDPAVPSGMLMYFHGNDLDPDDTYQPPFYEFQDRADAHGLIAAALKSIDRRTNADGTISREWRDADGRLLEELLRSDIGGCFKLDRTRIYLEGASQGACFLSANLAEFLPSDFQGGVIGLCGCWGTATFNHPVDIPTLRSRWKVFVENTTGDFLHDQGVMGLDIYKYNYGADVRADLDRAGGHCVDMRANAAAALNWMIDGTAYADPDANQPHWQALDTTFNPLIDVAYDTKNARFVIAVQRPDVSAEVRNEIEKARRERFVDDVKGFLDWLVATYPQYKTPPVQILTSSDYGATIAQIARRDVIGTTDSLWDMTVAPDGSILLMVGLGLSKVNEATKTIDPFAFPKMLIYGLDRDDAGNLFAHGAVIKLQRSRDSGATWTELAVPVRNNNTQWTVTTGGGRLTVIGSDGQVYSSADGGDTFSKAALPTGTTLDFASYGKNLYAVMDDNTLRVSQDAGTTWRTATVPTGIARAVEMMPNGDVVLAAGAVANDVGLSYRSKDAGQTWNRERGAHSDAIMEFVGGKTGEAMMVTTRGILRYSSGPSLTLGTPLPPLTGGRATGGNTGGGGAGGAGGLGGAGSGGTVAGHGGSAGGSGGTTGANSGDGSGTKSGGSRGGCGCDLSGQSGGVSSAVALLVALGLVLRRRRREASLAARLDGRTVRE